MIIARRIFLTLAPRFAWHGSALLASLALAGGHAFAADKPHMIFVMADDMGWGQTGYRGHPVLKTPHLDAMGGERAALRALLCRRAGVLAHAGVGADRAFARAHGRLAEWKQRWEYQSYIERAQGGSKNDPAKGGAKKRKN